jgi:hypothetical protein
MRTNYYYPLQVLLTSVFIISLACALRTEIRWYPEKWEHQSFLFYVGFFFGVFIFSLLFSVPIFICYYVFFYWYIVKFFLPAYFVKSYLFVFCLAGTFIANYIFYPSVWLHPFFMVYLAGALPGICLFHVYSFDLEYLD